MNFKFMRQGFGLFIFSFIIVAGFVLTGCESEPGEKVEEKLLVWSYANGLRGILNKGEEVEQRKQYIKDYLLEKYKKPSGERKEVEVEVSSRHDGSINSFYMYGDFTPQGFEHKEGTYEYMRALAHAFFNEEKELLGVGDPDMELKEFTILTNELNGETEEKIFYGRVIDGVVVHDERVRVDFINRKPVGFAFTLDFIAPEMVEAVKRFKAEGFPEEGVKNVVINHLREQGVPEEAFDSLFFGYVPKLFVIKDPPYVVRETFVSYQDYLEKTTGRRDYSGNWMYWINATTGEVVKRYRPVEH